MSSHEIDRFWENWGLPSDYMHESWELICVGTERKVLNSSLQNCGNGTGLQCCPKSWKRAWTFIPPFFRESDQELFMVMAISETQNYCQHDISRYGYEKGLCMETPEKRSKFPHRPPETLIPCVYLVSAHCVHQSHETQQPQQKVWSYTTSFKVQSNFSNELMYVSYRRKT